MPITNCTETLAKSIAQDCTHPLVAGYTGRAVLIPYENIDTLTQNTTNPRKLEAVTLVATTGKCVAVDNIMPTPFDGSNKASSADSGRIKYTKTLTPRIPLRGAAVSKELIEPLMTHSQGFLAIVEKLDKAGAGSYEVIGLNSPLKANADGLTQSEGENGGEYIVTMSCSEAWAEAEFMPSAGTYAAAKTAFETLYNTNSY